MYLEMNHDLFTQVRPEHYYRGYQKIDTCLIAFAEKIGEFPLTLKDMNYTHLKMNNLIKHYFNEKELEKYKSQRVKALKAKQASMFFSTIGEAKGAHKKDHCIRGVGINFIGKKIVHVHLFYRSSEISRKFLADLIFFSEFLFPKLEIPTDVPCTFHFTCGYVHAKQFPNYLVTSQDKKIDNKIKIYRGWEDERMEAQVKKNLVQVIEGKIPGFGMIRATNKLFQEAYESSKRVRTASKYLID